MSRERKIRAIASLVDKEFVTTTQVARILGVALPTVKRMIERGELRAIAIGNRYRINEEDLYDFLIKKGMVTPEVMERIHKLDKPLPGDNNEFEP